MSSRLGIVGFNFRIRAMLAVGLKSEYLVFFHRSAGQQKMPHYGQQRCNVRESLMRIGNAYDIHRLVEGRRLILGGVEIPHDKGLLGHSDADVLTHAIMDALLGALALGGYWQVLSAGRSAVGRG